MGEETSHRGARERGRVKIPRATVMAVLLTILGLIAVSMATPSTASADLISGLDPDPPAETLIVGGQEADSGEYPFMTAQADFDRFGNASFNCGGSLIAARWVLTAAHCVENKDAADVGALVGAYDLSADDGAALFVQNIYMHPAYDEDAYGNDLALLELSTSSTRPIVVLATSTNATEWVNATTATVIGWGDTETALGYPDVLREVDVPILTDAQCLETNAGPLVEPAIMICAGELGKDSCSGDSGGPLLVTTSADQLLQIGAVSFGNGCADLNDPGVYVELASYTDWIETHTGPLAQLAQPTPTPTATATPAPTATATPAPTATATPAPTPPIVAISTCQNSAGTVDVSVRNDGPGFATFRVTVGNRSAQQRSFSAGLSVTVTESDLADGQFAVKVTSNGFELFNELTTVNCGEPEATATPTPVVSTPVPATPTPNPAPIPVPSGPEVDHRVSCLGGNGRVDTNIVNADASAATYRLEFASLSARQRSVDPGDWWRSPITGRPDGDHNVVLKRNGITISDTTVTVACDGANPQVSTPEVSVVNSCRAGNGYVLFQMVNPTGATKAYVIEFEGVINRSTTAAPHGAAVRAVTGRPDGEFNVLIRSGAQPVAQLMVTVDCD